MGFNSGFKGLTVSIVFEKLTEQQLVFLWQKVQIQPNGILGYCVTKQQNLWVKKVLKIIR